MPSLFSFLLSLLLLLCLIFEARAEDLAPRIAHLIRKEEFTAALRFLDHSPDEGESAAARRLFLTGLCRMGLEQWEEAKAVFLEAQEKIPVLSDYSGLNILRCDYHLGNYEDVARRAKDFPSGQPESRLVPESRLIRLKSLVALKNWKEAEILLREMTAGENKNNSSETWRLYADVLQEQEKMEAAYGILQKIYYDFPLDPESTAAWQRMRELEEKFPPKKFPPPLPAMVLSRWERLLGSGRHAEVLQEINAAMVSPSFPVHLRGELYILKGRCYRALRDFPKAVEMYKTYIRKFPASARVPECIYQVAKIQWNAGKLEAAEETCGLLIKKYPGNPWTLRGYFVLGGVKENKEDLSGAMQIYKRLLEVSSRGDLFEDASWRVAWIYYLRKDYDKALEELEAFLARAPLSPDRGRALYWAFQCAEALKRPEKAQGYLRLLLESETHEFYGYLAGYKNGNLGDVSFKIFKGDLSRRAVGEISFPETLAEPVLPPAAVLHLEKNGKLVELGLYPDAREELRFVHRDINKRNINEVLWLGSQYYRSRAYRPLLSLMHDYLLTVAPRDRAGLPTLFWRLYYPPAFHKWVTEAGKKYGVDPFLILGLIRQESSFEEDALSPAEAMGLMQLIPRTGEKTFRKIYKEKKFSRRELYDPEVNINLGVFHLSELIKKSGGDLVKILIGYNAGMKKTYHWQKRFKKQRGEEFIEMIPYGETKNYVKKVLRNYFNYQRFHGTENENTSS